MRSGKPDNPFIVQRLGPSNLSFFFEDGESLKILLEELEDVGWTMELIGPHGAGKSTLLDDLEKAAQQRGMRTTKFEFHDESQSLPWRWRKRLAGVDLCLLDGGERLKPGSLRRLTSYCRKTGVGLIATTHEPRGIGTVKRIEATPAMFAQLTRRLLENRGEPRPLTEEESARLLDRHDGNARDAFFELYDSYEKDALGEVYLSTP